MLSDFLEDEELFKQFRDSVPEKSTFSELKDSFLHSIEENTEGIEKAAILFSAGVDSSLIAEAVSQKVEKTVLYTVGLEESSDIIAAEQGAGQLGLPLIKRIVSREEIPKYIEKTKKAIKNDDLFQLQIAVPEYIAAEKINNDGLRVVFSGQGSDELFCGYDSFRRILKENGYTAVQEEIWKKLENLYSHDLYREQAIAEHFALELRIPFLNEEFAGKAVAIPAEEKILSPDDMLRKHALRKLAREFSIPESICNKPKKAIQYGSGLAREIKKLA